MTDPSTMTESPRRQPLRDGLRFFGNFVRRPKSVGAVLPSSRGLSQLLVGDMSGLKPGDLVVEFGPGTGPVTKVLAEQLPEGVHYLGFELNDHFFTMLEQRFPQLAFHNGSAGDIAQVLKDRGLPKPARIISGLPFASLPPVVQDAVVAGVCDTLPPEGEFRTFQYVHAYQLSAAKRFRKLMGGHFPVFERLGPVMRNVPPAYVLRYMRPDG